MQFDPGSLEVLRAVHPSWRLLRYERAPLAIAFLHHGFIAPNARSLPEDEAVELLDDLLGAGRLDGDGAAGSKSAREYLLEWSSDERGFVRRYYPLGGEEAHVAVTPGAERAVAWLASLDEAAFVGTESRLLTAIELLRQLDIGTDANVEVRLADLRQRRAALDAEITRIEGGDVRLLDDRAVAERFQQFVGLSRELLADFRQVEENFRALDRSVRERIAQWDGTKGGLLAEVFGERDLIAASDQGASFRAFWDVLSAVSRQDELSARLNRITQLPAVAAAQPDRRIRRVHHDWFNAGDHTQRMVASLTAQLRRFIDDRTWLENRRIIEIIRSVEGHALAIREEPPRQSFNDIAGVGADISLPMERRLASAQTSAPIEVGELLDDELADIDALFADTAIDPMVLAGNVNDLLDDRDQVTLADVCRRYPLSAGLTELVAYLHVADDRFERAVLDDLRDRISWDVDDEASRAVDMPRVVFVRG
ncbi:MAG: DUF3375 domain-containing protein [Ilumatobacteraceae bacterium]